MLALLLASATAAPAQSLGERIAGEAAVDAKAAHADPTSMDGARIALPGGVTGLPALTYATLRGFRPLTLDLYLPPASFANAGPRPVIVIIHGGGWIYGNPRRTAAFEDWPRTLARIAEQGYVVAAVSYRFASEAPFPAALQDVKSAIRWLRAQAPTYHIDPDRFVSWGDSSGGQLSAMIAVSCGVAALEPKVGEDYGADLAPPPAGVSDCVQGGVAWYGAYDFMQPIGGPFPIYQHPFFDCHGAPCREDKLKPPSAVTYIDPKDPPMLLLHGAGDKSAPPAQSREFLARLQAAKVPARLVMIPDVDHAWIGATPEITRAASREALALSLDFTQSIIGDKPAPAPAQGH